MTPRDAASAEAQSVYGTRTFTGCSDETYEKALAHVRKVLGAKKKPTRPAMSREEILWLRSFNWSWDRIAARFGVSRDAVHTAVRRG